MLQLILSRNDQAFTEIESQLRNSIRRIVEPFSRDRRLRLTEGVDSLYNLALLKLREAMDNFVYESSLTVEHNERRFLSMLFMYIRNAMIDEQYAANVEKRKPKTGIQSLSGYKPFSIDGVDYENIDYDPFSKEPPVEEQLHVKEVLGMINEGLGSEERKILALLCDGYSAEGIAGKLGLQTSRVRYVIYEKIQKKAQKYVGR